MSKLIRILALAAFLTLGLPGFALADEGASEGEPPAEEAAPPSESVDEGVEERRAPRKVSEEEEEGELQK